MRRKRKIWKKTIIFVKIMKNIKNWHTFILDHLTFINNEYTIYRLRKGINLKAQNNSIDKHVIYDIYIEKFYNPSGFEIQPNDIIIDIGAHKGYFSIYAGMSNKGISIYSYEPNPVNFNILKENIELNHEALSENSSSINIFNCAIFKYKNKKRLYICENNTGMHSLYREYAGDKFIDVNCKTLEDIITENNLAKVDFLKLDCEGCEYEILINASIEALRKIRKIVLEYHSIKSLKYTFKELIDFLDISGFKVKFNKITSEEGILYAKRD